MLRSFRVANHRSVRDEQELVLLPAYDKSRPVTPVAAVYGANASGKSNLLDALRWMRYAVRDSYAQWEPGGGVPRSPFLLDVDSRTRVSTYSVDLELAGVRYTYGFSVDDLEVAEEWLYAYPRRRRRVVFERGGGRFTFGSTVGRRLETASELTRPNALLLSVAARSNVGESMAVYQWFASGMRMYQTSTRVPSCVHEWLSEDGARRRELLELLRSADLGITGLRSDPGPVKVLDFSGVDPDFLISVVDQRELSAPPISSRHAPVGAGKAETIAALINGAALNRRLVFEHGPRGVELGLADESEGTKAWLNIVCAALDVLHGGALLLVDELDISLHPRLIARLIELFEDERSNPRHAQLVFTTHDAVLLGTGLGAEVLRRDEVWFVEKDHDGATKLFPLTDFHPRRDENTERRYLGGSYGAVPAVYADGLVERLLAVRAGADERVAS